MTSVHYSHVSNSRVAGRVQPVRSFCVAQGWRTNSRLINFTWFSPDLWYLCLLSDRRRKVEEPEKPSQPCGDHVTDTTSHERPVLLCVIFTFGTRPQQ